MAASFIWEAHMLPLWLVCGVLDVFWSLAADIMYDPVGLAGGSWRVPLFGFGVLLILLVAGCMRWRILKKSRMSIKADQVGVVRVFVCVCVCV